MPGGMGHCWPQVEEDDLEKSSSGNASEKACGGLGHGGLNRVMCRTVRHDALSLFA